MLLLRWALLLGYWTVLTKALVSVSPWTVLSRSLAEHPPVDTSYEPLSWVLHLIAFGVLGGLLRGVLPKKPIWKTFWLLTAYLYGPITEWLQSFVPGRCASLGDISFNCLGLSLGLALEPLFAAVVIAWFFRFRRPAF